MNKYLSKLITVENKYDDILHITANENVMSPLVSRFYASTLGARYDMGSGTDGVVTHGNFAAKGMPEIRPIIDEAVNKTNEMLGAEYSILNCLSGVHATLLVTE